jgi:hypothetical protein
MRARLQTLFEGSANRGGYAARVPIEPQHAAECLEPVRIGDALQECIAAVLLDDELHDLRRQPLHAAEQIGGCAAAVQRQIRGTYSPDHPDHL